MTRQNGSGNDELEQKLGYSFVNRRWLETALTHRSHAHEHREEGRANYERLELLGDALLGFLVADWLYRDDEEAPEGLLSRRRQKVVRTTTLAEVAGRLGLGEVVRLGRGEERTGGRRKPSLLADIFEAVLAAVYLDGGIRPARSFVRRHLGSRLRESRSAAGSGDDYKTRLQELVQARLQCTPRYRIVSTSGPAHQRRFEAEVVVDGQALASGAGTNRKRAEQAAAQEALSRLRESGSSDDGT